MQSEKAVRLAPNGEPASWGRIQSWPENHLENAVRYAGYLSRRFDMEIVVRPSTHFEDDGSYYEEYGFLTTEEDAQGLTHVYRTVNNAQQEVCGICCKPHVNTGQGTTCNVCISVLITEQKGLPCPNQQSTA